MRRRRRRTPAPLAGAASLAMPAPLLAEEVDDVRLRQPAVLARGGDARPGRACSPRRGGARTGSACRRLAAARASPLVAAAVAAPAPPLPQRRWAAPRPTALRRRAGGCRAAPSSIIASTWPLVTVVPLSILISRTTPFAGAGTSSTTLSVSRSARFSSRLTASPGCLCQATSVASATDSGSWGTRISVVMSSFLNGVGRGSSAGRVRERYWCRQPRGLPRGLLGRRRAQRRIDERSLLGLMDLGDAGRRRRGRRTARVQHLATAARQLPAGDGGSGTRRPGSAALPGTTRSRGRSR